MPEEKKSRTTKKMEEKIKSLIYFGLQPSYEAMKKNLCDYNRKNRHSIKSNVGWLGFYGISTFVGYFMPNPF